MRSKRQPLTEAARAVASVDTLHSTMIRNPRFEAQPRTLHIVDLENLAGTATLSREVVTAVRHAYALAAPLGPTDQVVIATAHRGFLGAALGWSGARFLIASGPHGADNQLLAVIARENLPARFDHVVIASGDGIFADPAARLQAAGVAVTVVVRPGALSRRLRFAVRDVRLLGHTSPETKFVTLQELAG